MAPGNPRPNWPGRRSECKSKHTAYFTPSVMKRQYVKVPFSKTNARANRPIMHAAYGGSLLKLKVIPLALSRCGMGHGETAPHGWFRERTPEEGSAGGNSGPACCSGWLCAGKTGISCENCSKYAPGRMGRGMRRAAPRGNGAFAQRKEAGGRASAPEKALGGAEARRMQVSPLRIAGPDPTASGPAPRPGHPGGRGCSGRRKSGRRRSP